MCSLTTRRMLKWTRICFTKTLYLYTVYIPVALQSLKNLGLLTYRRFLELFRRMVGLLGRVISPSQGLYLHRTTQHRKTRTNIQALSGIRTQIPETNRPRPTPQTAQPVHCTSDIIFTCEWSVDVIMTSLRFCATEDIKFYFKCKHV
jgi:hypothetical protein